MIRADPDREANRMNHLLADLPIEVEVAQFGGKPERLPKQLSRSLLPANRDETARVRVMQSLQECTRRLGASRYNSSGSVSPANVSSSLSRRESVSHGDYSDRKLSDANTQVQKRPSRSSLPEESEVTLHRGRTKSNTSSRRHSSPVPKKHETRQREHAASRTRRRSRSRVRETPEEMDDRRQDSRSRSNRRVNWARTASVIPDDTGRRSRKDEYRLMQGRDPHHKIEDTKPPPLLQSSTGEHGSRRRRSAVSVRRLLPEEGIFDEFMRGRGKWGRGSMS